MTEKEWRTSTDPRAMLEVAHNHLRSDYPHGPRTERKRSFFGAACCRLVWPLVAADARCRRAVEYYESRFDRRYSNQRVEKLFWNVKQAAEHPKRGTLPARLMAANLVYDAGSPSMAVGQLLASHEGWDGAEHAPRVADLLREIVGNPFRPIVFDSAWRSSDVMLLAAGIYDERAFDRLPILADALQDAGCDSDDLLNHLRDPNATHVRGCWALDLVLGEE